MRQQILINKLIQQQFDKVHKKDRKEKECSENQTPYFFRNKKIRSLNRKKEAGIGL